jgi:hypothetical protein
LQFADEPHHLLAREDYAVETFANPAEYPGAIEAKGEVQYSSMFRNGNKGVAINNPRHRPKVPYTARRSIA